MEITKDSWTPGHARGDGHGMLTGLGEERRMSCLYMHGNIGFRFQYVSDVEPSDCDREFIAYTPTKWRKSEPAKGPLETVFKPKHEVDGH